MATILDSTLTSTATVNTMADDVVLTAKKSLYGLTGVAKRTWIELFFYFQLYNILYLDSVNSAVEYLTAQETLDIKEEIYQTYIP